jgi:hypothetical protein
MAYSYVDLVGTGGQQNFNFSIPYLSADHLYVYIDDVITEDWELTATFVMRLDSALAGDATVRIQRITPIDEPAVDFTNGSTLGDSDLDIAFLQTLYSQQEIADQRDGLASIQAALAAGYASAALVAQAAAELAETHAETAETNAETAETNAETAETNAAASAVAAAASAAAAAASALAAQTAETNAELAETNAELAETNAETAQAAAAVSAAAASASATAAQTAETNAETAETNAETAETNAETAATNAAASAAAASTSATNAATAETNAETAETNAAASAAAAAASAATATMSENPIINPCMELWQRATTFASIADAAYSADRWVYTKSGAMVHDVSRSTDVPTVVQAGVLFNYSLLVDCTTIDGAIAAGDLCAIRQRIEGFNWRHFAQRALTLSFWVKATKTGTYCIAISNSGNDRTFLAEYTVNVTDTWEKKTINITASPSAGTWDYLTGVGAELRFTLAAGSTFQSTTGWTTGNFLGTANQVNGCDNVANNFRLTGVKLELGSTATDLRFRPFNHELALCQRYYEIGQDAMFSGNTTNAVVYYTQNTFRVYKRAAPTMTFTDISNSGFAAGNPTGFSAQQTIAICSKTANATANGSFYRFSWIANSEL